MILEPNIVYYDQILGLTPVAENVSALRGIAGHQMLCGRSTLHPVHLFCRESLRRSRPGARKPLAARATVRTARAILVGHASCNRRIAWSPSRLRPARGCVFGPRDAT